MEVMMAPLVVVVTGNPHWLEALRLHAAQDGYELRHYTRRDRYVSRLAEDHAALVVVDGDDEGWRYWAVSAKVSPATRRIPVLLVTGSPERGAEARAAGADSVITPGNLAAGLPEVLRSLGRVLPGETHAQLLAACAQPLPPRAVEAIEQFNKGEYYRQHDLLEAQWVAEPGPVRDLYRAILQVGIAYYQIGRRNRRGALKMLLRSLQWLAILPDVCQGVDVARLRTDAAQVRHALERITDDEIAAFDRALLRPVRMSTVEERGTEGPRPGENQP